MGYPEKSTPPFIMTPPPDLRLFWKNVDPRRPYPVIRPLYIRQPENPAVQSLQNLHECYVKQGKTVFFKNTKKNIRRYLPNF